MATFSDEQNAVAGKLREICSGHDTRAVFLSFLGFASVIGQQLLAAKLMSLDDAQSVLQRVAEDMLTPLETAPTVLHKNESGELWPTNGGKVH